MNKQQKIIRQIVIMGLLIAMSVIGAFIKIPSPTGTVALDSLPGYLAALLLGGVPGAVVAFLGHLASAATTGFPMTLPIHLLVACQMVVIMLIFSFMAKKFHLVAAMIIGILLNGIAAPAVFILVPGFGVPFFIAMVLPLTVVSAINVILAGLVYYPLRNTSIVRKLQGTGHGI